MQCSVCISQISKAGKQITVKLSNKNFSTLAQCTVWIFPVCASESVPVHLLVQRKSGGESPHHEGIKGESDTLSTSTS